jgi:hypothetical protein
MVKYNESIIYKLCCKDLEIKDEYVGSTTNFTRRKNQHKTSCNNSNNYNVYKCIRENGGFYNWDMIEVEKYSAVDKHDLHKRERYWIEQLKPTLNKQLPTQTPKEYYEKNTDKIAQNKKEYREQNWDKIAQNKKEYQEQNADTIAQYQKEYYNKNTDKIRHKINEYCQKNADTIAHTKKEYYNKNYEKIKQHNNEKITCECGLIVNKSSLTRHKKSKKHTEQLKNKLT